MSGAQPDKVIEALNSIDRKWTEMEDPREFVDSPVSLSTSQLNERKDIIYGIATELLPSIQKQLDNLTKKLGLGPFARNPIPQLGDTQEVVSKLALILDRTDDCIVSLAPDVWDGTGSVTDVDQDYGVMKRIRCNSLFRQFRDLLEDDMHKLIGACIEHIEYFRSGQFHRDQEVIKANDNYLGSPQPYPSPHPAGRNIVQFAGSCREEIDTMIDICTRSDLAFLQIGFKWVASRIDQSLVQIGERLSAEKGQLIDRVDRAADGPPDVNANALQEVDPNGPPEPNPPEPISVRSEVIPLLRMAIPVCKLVRIFLHRLLNKPSATQIRLGDQLSSVDMYCLKKSVETVHVKLQDIVETLCSMYDQDRLVQTAFVLEKWPRSITMQLNYVIVLFSLYHIPSSARSAAPPSARIFKPLFYSLQCQLFVATRNFRTQAIRLLRLRGNQEDPELEEELQDEAEVINFEGLEGPDFLDGDE
ncbi:hypothetical protein PCANC_07858 [Puccinia coronata f. sp. avenae]|uniref:Uncharacterized protein n=1 Tax=Puccinia coronata f. sp. avenae TaxID=200324 RepID=A0A2N5VD11_9BASI|nr:hypothetical protein PCANC_07858 [Puccinia coronata f. sp. avenae]